MLDNFLFVGLAYIALAVCIFGSFYRLKLRPFSQSALSSQFLEGNQLLWGSLPWHIGIGLILLAHLLALFFPGLWYSVLLNKTCLYMVEGFGVALATLAIIGLVVLLIRRVTSARVQAVTTAMDILVLLLLIFQVGLGLITAICYRWGSLWATSTATPYIWSILTLKPDSALVAHLPIVVKGHILGAWLLLIVLPFSRLIHMFALPIEYLWRPPQKVIWTNPRHEESAAENVEVEEARRYFLRGMAGIAAGGVLFGVGATHKLAQFFFGPRLSKKDETELMASRVNRLEKTIEQKKYELERQQNDYIYVSKLSELDPRKGKYFIDYEMRPALAFRDANGFPLLISAKCTHLGCTVGCDVDAQGKILCPCHVSYFDVQTGIPNPDSPAKAPLPHLGWVLMNQEGKMIATKPPDGPVAGSVDTNELDKYSVFIAKYFKKEQA